MKLNLQSPGRHLRLPEFNNRWVRVIIVLVVMALAGGLGFLASSLAERFNPILLAAAAAPLGLVAVVVLVEHREYMPVVVAFAAGFIPWGLPTGTQSKIQPSLMLTIVFVGFVVLRMIVDRKIHLEPSPFNWSLLGFSGFTLWSIVWSNLVRDPMVYTPNSFIIVQIASGVTMVMLPGAMLLVNNIVQEVRTLKWMTGVTLAAGAFYLIDRFNIVHLPMNLFGLFNMWVVVLSISLAIFVRRMSWPLRLFLLALGGAYTFWGMVLQIHRLAAWIPELVALGILLFIRSRKAFVAALVLGAVVAAVNWGYLLSVRDDKQSESGDTRMAAWDVNWQVTKDHLLFGTGPAGYAVYYMSYFPEDAMATHNNYIDILSETGVVGSFFWLAFEVTALWFGLKLVRRVRGRGDFVEAMANAGLAGMVGAFVIMAFGDWVLPFAYTQTIASFDYEVQTWLFLGALMVLERLTRPGAEAALQPVEAETDGLLELEAP